MKFIIPEFESDKVIQVNTSHTQYDKRIMSIYLDEDNEDTISKIIAACKKVKEDTIIIIENYGSTFEYSNFIFDRLNFEMSRMSGDEIDAGNADVSTSNCTIHFKTA